MSDWNEAIEEAAQTIEVASLGGMGDKLGACFNDATAGSGAKLADAIRKLKRPQPPGRCRVCGCTDDDCSGCVARTGERCYWVEPDLCSACAVTDAALITTRLTRRVMDLEAAATVAVLEVGMNGSLERLSQVVSGAPATWPWIDARERLPETRQSVIFVVDQPDDEWNHGRVLGGIYKGSERYDFYTPGIAWVASHWMPAPPAPPESRPQPPQPDITQDMTPFPGGEGGQ